MNTYKIDYIWNGNGCHVTGVINEDALRKVESHPKHKIVSVIPYTPVIRYQTVEGCERCKTDEQVRHFQCHYDGKPAGHSVAHCTADGCW